MTTTNENIEVEVPACFIKDKAVDFDGEMFSVLGGGIRAFGQLIKAPSLGVFSLLESFECKIISDPENATKFDVWRILYINDMRSECVQEVMDWAYPDKGAKFNIEETSTWTEFDFNVASYGMEICEDLTDAEFDSGVIAFMPWLNLSFEGFDMIPGQASTSAYWFGAESIASMASSLNMSANSVLWETPMSLIGHLVAATARYNGNEHVARKKDVEDIALQLQEAKQRVRDGVFHPWQIANPEQWPLESVQVKHAPNIRVEWEALVKENQNG